MVKIFRKTGDFKLERKPFFGSLHSNFRNMAYCPYRGHQNKKRRFWPNFVYIVLIDTPQLINKHVQEVLKVEFTDELAWWIICIIVGGLFLIFFTILCILWKCGFFRRTVHQQQRFQ